MSDPIPFQVRQVEISSAACDACVQGVRTDLFVKASGVYQFSRGDDTSHFLSLILTDDGNDGHIDTHSFNCRRSLAISEDCSSPPERLQTEALREGRQLLEEAKEIVEEAMRLFSEKGPKSRAMDERFIFEKSGRQQGQFSFYSTHYKRRFQITLSRDTVFKHNGLWTVCPKDSPALQGPSNFRILIEIGSKKVVLADRASFCGRDQDKNAPFLRLYQWVTGNPATPSPSTKAGQ